MDSAQIYKAIGDFLAAHGLWPTPDNYALIYALFANEASPAAAAVKAATADGLRLSQRDADRIKDEVGIEPSAAPSLTGVDPALLAAVTQQIEEFVAVVETQRASAQSYGADLSAGADRIEAGEGGSIEAMIAITRAMAERTRAVEEELTAARDESSKLREKLAVVGEDARSDPLTRLPNRRAFEERLKAFEESGDTVSLAICDIDNFKRINDLYGHPVGDRVIRVVAETLRDNCAGNMVARIGGEEFVVLFEGIAPSEGARILDEARESLGARNFKIRETDAPLGRITFSAGVACAQRKTDRPAIARADALLYEAKKAGRNQIRFESG